MPLPLQTLINIGLSAHEAEVYSVLLTIGKSEINRIRMKATGINRSNLYAVLDNLVEKGVVLEYTAGNRKSFAPAPPQELDRLLEKQRSRVAMTEKEFEYFLPDLQREYYGAMKRPTVVIEEGIEGIKKVYENMLRYPHLPSFTVISEAKPHPDLISWIQTDFGKRRIKSGQFLYQLVADSPFAHMKQSKDAEEKRKTVIIKKDEFPFGAELALFGESKVAHISNSENEQLAFVIDSKSVYQSILAMFKLAWQGAGGEKLPQ